MNDPEFKRLTYLNERFTRNSKGTVLATDYIPILRFFLKKQIQKLRTEFGDYIQILKQKYLSHQSDYQEGIIRDFTDALISAKLDALQNEKESAPYLTDDNLALTLFDLFLGFYIFNFFYQLFIDFLSTLY